ncbi:MAG: glycosyltransferase family 4 protein [Patescibacteria group bacterium]
MNILYVLNSGNPGGMEQHVLDLVKGMHSRGYRVHVWCSEGSIVELYKNAGAQVTVKPISFDIDPSYIKELHTYLLTNNIDVLHSHELKAGINALIAATLAGTKVKVSHVHTPISEWKVPNWKKVVDILIYTMSVAFLSNIEIALTASRKSAKLKEGIPSNKLGVIPNAINVSDYTFSSGTKSQYRAEILTKHNIPANRFIFGNISRTSVEKGHSVLIEAFSKFFANKHDKENFHLLIAGGGELEEALIFQINELNLTNYVTITGRFAESDKLKYYASFDSFVFPSFAEGFGIVLIEAMAAGLPVICSNLPVLCEVAQDNVAYFNVGDSQDLAEKLNSLVVDQQKLNSIGQNARMFVKEHYSMDKFIENYIKLYTYLLNKGKK